MGQERLQMGGDLLLHALLRPAPTHSSAVKGDADASELSACKSSMRNEARDVLQLMRFPQHSHLAQAMDAYGEAVPRLQSLRSDALHHLIRYPPTRGVKFSLSLPSYLLSDRVFSRPAGDWRHLTSCAGR
ncbi:hypothetical protein CBM2615_U10075 [Cupriavidus taiwanensis]|nr:hypothetical protein CBM2615_U10075 [Cupriavidus taiwanensis]